MPIDPDSPQVLACVANEIEAAAIETLLAGHHIKSTTTGGFTSDFRAEAPGKVQVVVRQADLQRAQQVLEEARQP